MTGTNAIRGTRVGSGPVRWADAPEQTDSVARQVVGYWCANGHHIEHVFAAEAVVPPTWDCPRCGQPAGQDEANPPGRAVTEPYKTHLAYVKERRSVEEGETILAEALARLRQRRGEA